MPTKKIPHSGGHNSLIPLFSATSRTGIWWTFGFITAGFFAFSTVTEARSGGNHMSGQGHGGNSQQYGYCDPFSGSWHPGYAGNYDTTYSYTPTPTQATTAQTRVQNYLSAVRKNKRRPASHRYIAVETLKPTQKQLADYAKKQAEARSAAATGGAQMSNRWVSPNQLRCLMVFDTQSKQFVGSGCYVVGSLPPVGTVAKFDTFSAEFVGIQAL
jgi:hypothetical protein